MSDERYVWGRIADPAMAMASESAASGMEAVKVMVEAVMVAVATGMRNRRRGAPRPN